MKIGLLDVDGHNFPNLALMKIASYHKRQGDDVEWALSMMEHYNRIFASNLILWCNGSTGAAFPIRERNLN